MGVELKSEYLKSQIANKLGCKEEELTENDLIKITSLDLKKEDMFGDKLDMTIEDLTFFKNLNELTISMFDITDDDLDFISYLEKLEFLCFDFCRFSINRGTCLHSSLKQLYIDKCLNVKLDYFKCKNLTNLVIIGVSSAKPELDIEAITNMTKLEQLQLNNFKLKNIESNLDILEEIDFINFDGSIIQDSEIVSKLQDNERFSMKEEFFYT